MVRIRAQILRGCAATAVIWSVAVSNGSPQGPKQAAVKLNGPPASTLVAVEVVEHLDGRAREPMAVEHPDGTLFVSGFALTPDEPGPKLWKSVDHGQTWARVNVGTAADGAVGNSDVSLAMAPDGTLYFATMGPHVREGPAGKNTIAVGVTSDAGVTWHWTVLSTLSNLQFGDRPWVAVSTDGTAHVIWNDGNGVDYAVSHDRGINWGKQARIHGQGGSSHIAVGPNREVAVRVTPASASGRKFDADVDLIAVSGDGGATWRKHPAPGHREWLEQGRPGTFPPRWIEPLAWDAQGSLYSFWTDQHSLWLARSGDRGETWRSWHLAEREDISYYPYLVARGPGELILTWFSGRSDTLQAHLAKVNVAQDSTAPRMMEAPFFTPDTWSRPFGSPPETPLNRATLGEYLAPTFLKTGGFAVVSAIQNERDQRFGFTWRRFGSR